jgi:DNA-binding NarL/FixJ family response regulator
VNVVIVDDDPLVCASLKTILEAQHGVCVVGMGYDGGEAVSLYAFLRPDVLLLDIRMKTVSGLKAAEEILARFQDARILFLTTFSDDEYIVKALRIGVKGYLIKQNFESILPALRAVCSGQSVFGEEIVSKLPTLLNSGKPGLSGYGLTEKEEELAALVAQGLSNREIAESLYLSEGTVRNYLSTILEKLCLRDRTQLAVFYLKNGGQGN